eukprot:8220894-Pyramimonas_sp.AAC.1
MANEAQEYARLAWYEMTTGKATTYHQVNDNLKLVDGTLVTDCKAMYDSVARACSSGYGCNDQRSAIEALALKQSMKTANTTLRWVHSEAMIADGLTKMESPALQ